MKLAKCAVEGCYSTATCSDKRCTKHTQAVSPKRSYHYRRLPKSKELHLGIEVECIAKNQDALRAMSAQRLAPTHDGSLPENIGCEFKMLGPVPVIIKRAAAFCYRLQNLGATVTPKCGLHVHMDARQITHRQAHDFVSWLKPLEATFEAMMPRSRRFGRNEYLEAITTGYCHAHYQWAHRTCYDTVEIRIHPGTLNPFKVEGWLAACSDLMKLMHSGVLPPHTFVGSRKHYNPETNEYDLEDNSGSNARIATDDFLATVFKTPLALDYIMARLRNNGTLTSYTTTTNGSVCEDEAA